MKNVAPIRKDLGIRTIFNLLGPLANPANAKRQVIGVYKKNLTEVFAKVLKNLGSKKILVVHGADGMDEISMSGTTFVSELSEDSIKNYEINPEMFNLKSQANDFLYAEDVFSSKDIILKILQNEDIPAKNIVLLNAAAAIYVADKAESLKDAIYLAIKSIESGTALSKLEDLVKESNE
jgi:anthranilate phosphoribosyltransferase